jgi:hypothetical protein
VLDEEVAIVDVSGPVSAGEYATDPADGADHRPRVSTSTHGEQARLRIARQYSTSFDILPAAPLKYSRMKAWIVFRLLTVSLPFFIVILLA